MGIAASPAYATDLELSGVQPVLKGNAASNSEWGKATHSINAGKSVYIVELVDAPVATYDGGAQGLKATSNRVTGANRLDTNSKSSKAYRQFLKKQQGKFLKEAGKTAVKHDYQYVFNGVALEMSDNLTRAN